MPKKNNVLLEKKQIYPKDDEYESDEYEERIIDEPKPKTRKKLILPKNDYLIESNEIIQVGCFYIFIIKINRDEMNLPLWVLANSSLCFN